jgi:hypothetical protein
MARLTTARRRARGKLIVREDGAMVRPPAANTRRARIQLYRLIAPERLRPYYRIQTQIYLADLMPALAWHAVYQRFRQLTRQSV